MVTKPKKKSGTFPLVSLYDVVVFPGTSFPLYTNRHADIAAVEEAVQKDRRVILAYAEGPVAENTPKSRIAKVGVLSEVTHSVRLTSGEWKIRLNTLERVRVTSFVSMNPFVKARAQFMAVSADFRLSPAEEQLIQEVKSKFELLSQFDEILEDHTLAAGEVFDPGQLADIVAMAISQEPSDAQKMLEEIDAFSRLRSVDAALTQQLDVAAIRERISTRVEKELTRSEHEHLLREQLRQIQVELGEGPSEEDDLSELKDQLEKSKMPAAAKKEAKKQLRRLQQLHPDTSDAALARTYLDWIIDLPWSKRTKDRFDLRAAKALLDDEHYGLEKTKERILDFLGVRKLRKNLRGPILLLVGPPGVGKTSLGRSVAKALGRKFMRISVGGLRDEAELRGHRRTYVGALPGRIIQGLKNTGSKNPVFVLDEIDKIGSDFRGDPASVLLEVLDPEQNKTFDDHYLNIPFDLSEVMFIATANVTDTIPSALLGRMEIIEVAGYTLQEKQEIAKRHLIPREKRENGLGDVEGINIQDEALHHIITGYTRESGVRELGRTLGTVFRKIARSVAEGEKPPTEVSSEDLEKALGPLKYVPESRQRTDQVGVVTGLAWTSVGGETLLVEASVTKGKGQLLLTGQLGDVMKESAQAALTYVLSNADRYGYDSRFHENSNIHIHVPHGAIPKDGPSAGIAMATALVSLLTDRPVSRNVAMTGEMTLRGNVIAIGGLREKALAALRVGIPLVVIPKENERDLVEFPKYLLDKVTFVPVETIDEVLQVALIEKKPEPPRKKSVSQVVRR